MANSWKYPPLELPNDMDNVYFKVNDIYGGTIKGYYSSTYTSFYDENTVISYDYYYVTKWKLQ